MQIVRDSGMFDPVWYSRTYPEIAQSGLDPLRHFIERGWQNGHDPGPEFSTTAYLRANADVARSGMNPLLHYIEFGSFEGRDASGPPLVLQRQEVAHPPFEEPSPVLTFPITRKRAASWRRAQNLNRTDPHIMCRGGHLLGFIDNSLERSSIDIAFDALGFLSGYKSEPFEIDTILEMGKAPGHLIDAWYLGSSSLRTRWDAKRSPLVIRAYQHDPLLDGMISLVGEGLVATPIDVLDLKLKNSLFPLLFLFSDQKGNLRGSRLLSFPSLCRGGLHQCELLACHNDVMSESDRLQYRLLRIKAGEAVPAVTSIEVNLDGSDGRGPMFQKFCRLWLEKTIRVDVIPRTKTDRPFVASFLSGAVAVHPDLPRTGNSASLSIGSDMLPTIAALTEVSSVGAGHDGAEVLLPLLVASPTGGPAGTLLAPPRYPVDTIQILLAAGGWQWPQMRSSDDHVHSKSMRAGAVRYAGDRRITDAERFMPVSGTMCGSTGQANSVTWLIEVSRWSDDLLADSISALRAQKGSEHAALALIGSTKRAQRAIASASFPGRVNGFATRDEAIAAIDTALTGYIEPNVIMHDNRTTSLFAKLLNDSQIATASCVLLDVERRGRNWRVDVGDGGVLQTGDSPAVSPLDYATAINALWRCTYAVAKPPRELWICRSADVWDLVRGGHVRAGARHICTSLVTASRIARRRETAVEESHPIPDAAAHDVTAVEALIG